MLGQSPHNSRWELPQRHPGHIYNVWAGGCLWMPPVGLLRRHFEITVWLPRYHLELEAENFRLGSDPGLAI